MTSNEGRDDCVFCQLGEVSEGGQLHGTDVIVAYLDEELIALIPTERLGVLLAPREHAEALFDKPGLPATILGPLRQLVKQVKSFYGVEEARIQPITDFAGATGHLLYQVVPVLSGEEVRSDTMTLAAEVAETLRQHAARRRN